MKVQILKKSVGLNHRGLGLLEAIIGIGISGIFIAGMTSMILHVQKGLKDARTVQTRDTLQNYLNIVLLNKKSIDRSLNVGVAENKDLATCINGAAVAADKCISLDAPTVKHKTPFTLYAPNSNTPVSGPLGTPLFFSTTGAVCPGVASATAACPFTVETWFEADCGGATDCVTAAQDLDFFFEIKHHGEVNLRSGNNLSTAISWSSLNTGAVAAAATATESPPPLTCTAVAGNVSRCCFWASSTSITCVNVAGDNVEEAGTLKWVSSPGFDNGVGSCADVYVPGTECSNPGKRCNGGDNKVYKCVFTK
ncbi:MAG TPA: hypothetical protein PLJ21_08250 [Pseudobdellovibrionaceae bacterium]|nr:hypothetical protein [Pseudobdellovibrionaceae bacterium]